MSRSRKKVGRYGICTGSNTLFFRMRNKARRRKDRFNLRNLLANKRIEDVDDLFMHTKNNELTEFDIWNSPTDGYSYVRQGTRNKEEAEKVFRK